MSIFDDLTTLMTRKSTRRRRNENVQVIPQPAQQSLETRMLMSGTTLSTGVWEIRGTSGPDVIIVSRDLADPDLLVVEVNGQIIDEQFASRVQRIEIFGGSGDDRLEIDEAAGTLAIPTTIHVVMTEPPLRRHSV